MACKIHKGDTVMVVTGEHKGTTGRVMRVIPEKSRVLIEGVNLVHKHVRPSQRNPQGGRIRVEQPIHISNVMLVHPKTHRPVRAGFALDDDGTKKRVAPDGTALGGVVRKGKGK